MGMVFADPAMLEKLAASMDGTAKEIPALRRRASALDVLSEVGHLLPLLSYLNETARELRKKASILRSPSKSPFDALAQHGLPAGLARKPGAGGEFKTGLKKVLAEYETAVPEARARAVKEYVEGLTPEQQAALAVADPVTVGNLDGVPAPLRFAANRISIQRQYEKETRHLEELSPASPAFERSRERLLALQRFLSFRRQAVADPKTGKISYREIPRQFLVFQPEAGGVADPVATPFADGKIAEVLGDLETAGDVAFRVPGITNRLDNFQSFADGGVDLLVDGDGAERPDGAVISWLGYDTPEQGDSVDPAKAEVGGRELRAFRRGIGVSLRPDAKVGIFAHSYGTLVTSKALQEGMDDVDKVVFMGSPGLGPNIRSIKDFQMPNTRFFAMRAPGDAVSYTQGHGPDPADFPDITRLDTIKAFGHSDYYDPKAEGVHNLRRVFAGEYDSLTTVDSSLDEEMTGATEIRRLVGFLQERLTPEEVARLGGDIDPIAQGIVSGRMGFTDAAGPLYLSLKDHDLLDKVPPGELFSEVNSLASDVAAKETNKRMLEGGSSETKAILYAGAAKAASWGLAEVVTQPLEVAAKGTRAVNNWTQFAEVLAEGDLNTETWKKSLDKGSDAVTATIDLLNPF
ncbi:MULTISPECIES: alpha/beta hydrolase [Streptomyces]|uniref:alpha/beta hydrolase n=1 Tax=Streptomyces TaxID=1883 RepID=UPI001E4EFFE6|nr:alpha/beta hydrolase [Streptomyces sp. OUCMDZ-3434]